MKFTTAAAVLTLAASAIATPMYRRSLYVEDDSALAARMEDAIADYLEARWNDYIEDLEARAGPFANTNDKMKTDAKKFVDDSRKKGALGAAAAGGDSARTKAQTGSFHLDRQQGKNKDGSNAVAVQLNRPGVSTIGQVKIEKHPGGKQPADKTVGARLKDSINKGKETNIGAPKNQKGADGAKSARKADNIAKNQAAQAAKKERITQKQNAGNARAAQGIFKKGNGKPSVSKRK